MPSGVFKPYAGVTTAILLFTKVYDYEDEVNKIPTTDTFFYDMESDGYSMDDKRVKQDNHGDLQDIIKEYQIRDVDNLSDRKAKCFMVPFSDIKSENYDLSFNRYKEYTFEEIKYEAPEFIINSLIDTEVGKTNNQDLEAVIKGGIVKELLEIKDLLN